MEPLENAEITERENGRVRLRAGSATIEVTAIAPGIVRVGLFPDGRPPDYRSRAVVLESVGGDVDPARLDPFTFELGPPGEDPIGRELRVSAPKLAGERFFGCGERTSGLEKTASHQV